MASNISQFDRGWEVDMFAIFRPPRDRTDSEFNVRDSALGPIEERKDFEKNVFIAAKIQSALLITFGLLATGIAVGILAGTQPWNLTPSVVPLTTVIVFSAGTGIPGVVFLAAGGFILDKVVQVYDQPNRRVELLNHILYLKSAIPKSLEGAYKA